MEDGCGNAGFECFLPDDENQASYAYCVEHAFDNGFCRSCGQFWGGIESFEFLNGGLCDNCKDELEQEIAYEQAEDEPWHDDV